LKDDVTGTEKLNRPGVSGSKKDQECLKTRSSRPGEYSTRKSPRKPDTRPGECGTLKKEDQESLEPEEGRPGSLEPEEGRSRESGTGREKIRGVWNRKRGDQGSLEPEESIQGVLQKNMRKSHGRGI
jgi:hypothetical protein